MTTVDSATALKAIGILLHYPHPELQKSVDQLAKVLQGLPQLTDDEQRALAEFLRRLQQTDPYELQAEYVATFDHSKKVSLYLFEHVYGESRDRGQAMVELINAYRQRGLEIDGDQLPDYLPCFLEFCSLLPQAEALPWLEEIVPILQQIHVRLTQRGSPYSVPLCILLRMMGHDPCPDNLVQEVASEERDDTKAAFDRVWMEAPVTFGPGDSSHCGGTGTSDESPIRWVSGSGSRRDAQHGRPG